jgi:hypothetical protein
VSAFSDLQVPQAEGVELSISGNNSLRIAGMIAVRDPREPLGSFFARAHDAAVADRVQEVIVDVVDLKFVNSSAIRLFVDWATAVKNAGTPYRLKFKGKRAVAWQRTAFMALSSLAKDALEVEYVN